MPYTHIERPLHQDNCAYLAAYGWVHSKKKSRVAEASIFRKRLDSTENLIHIRKHNDFC